MKPTPETEVVLSDIWRGADEHRGVWVPVQMIEHARKLERQRDALVETLRFVRNDLAFAEWGTEQHGSELLKTLIDRNVPALDTALAKVSA